MVKIGPKVEKVLIWTKERPPQKVPKRFAHCIVFTVRAAYTNEFKITLDALKNTVLRDLYIQSSMQLLASFYRLHAAKAE